MQSLLITMLTPATLPTEDGKPSQAPLEAFTIEQGYSNVMVHNDKTKMAECLPASAGTATTIPTLVGPELIAAAGMKSDVTSRKEQAFKLLAAQAPLSGVDTNVESTSSQDILAAAVATAGVTDSHEQVNQLVPQHVTAPSNPAANVPSATPAPASANVIPQVTPQQTGDRVFDLLFKPVASLTQQDIADMAQLTHVIPDIAQILPKLAMATKSKAPMLSAVNTMELLTGAESRLAAKLASGDDAEKQGVPTYGVAAAVAEILREAIDSSDTIPNPARAIEDAKNLAQSGTPAKDTGNAEDNAGEEAQSSGDVAVPQPAPVVGMVMNDVVALTGINEMDATQVAAVMLQATPAVDAEDDVTEPTQDIIAGIAVNDKQRAERGFAVAAERAAVNLPAERIALGTSANNTKDNTGGDKPLQMGVPGQEISQLATQQSADTAPPTQTTHPVAELARSVQQPPVGTAQLPLRQLPQGAAPLPASEQIIVNINTALRDGLSRIQITLEPAELGKVEVQMDVDSDGRTGLVVTVDNKETLDLLQRDARSLEKALSDLGMKTDSNSLSFNLRGEQQGEARQQFAQARQSYNNAPKEEPEDVLAALLNPALTEQTMTLVNGVNIQV